MKKHTTVSIQRAGTFLTALCFALAALVPGRTWAADDEKAKPASSLAQAQSKADALLAQAKAKNDAILAKAKSQSSALLAKAKAESDSVLAGVKAKDAAMLANARAKADAILAEAHAQNEIILSEAKNQTEATLAEAHALSATAFAAEVRKGIDGLNAYAGSGKVNKTGRTDVSEFTVNGAKVSGVFDFGGAAANEHRINILFYDAEGVLLDEAIFTRANSLVKPGGKLTLETSLHETFPGKPKYYRVDVGG